jgi:hypothetical protein
MKEVDFRTRCIIFSSKTTNSSVTKNIRDRTVLALNFLVLATELKLLFEKDYDLSFERRYESIFQHFFNNILLLKNNKSFHSKNHI